MFTLFRQPLQVAAHRTIRAGIIKLLWYDNGAGPELEAFAVSQGVHPAALGHLQAKSREGG